MTTESPRAGFYPSIPIAEYAGTRYNPSNGTEGEMFISSWCEKCARDKHMNGTSIGDSLGNPDPDDFCQHLNDSFMDGGTEAWVFGDDGYPKCTQFVAMGDPIVERDDKTIDMFGG